MFKALKNSTGSWIRFTSIRQGFRLELFVTLTYENCFRTPKNTHQAPVTNRTNTTCLSLLNDLLCCVSRIVSLLQTQKTSKLTGKKGSLHFCTWPTHTDREFALNSEGPGVALGPSLIGQDFFWPQEMHFSSIGNEVMPNRKFTQKNSSFDWIQVYFYPYYWYKQTNDWALSFSLVVVVGFLEFKDRRRGRDWQWRTWQVPRGWWMRRLPDWRRKWNSNREPNKLGKLLWEVYGSKRE